MGIPKLIAALLLVSVSSFGQQKRLGEAYDLKWEYQIGLTTFRTNILCSEGRVVVGSNGLTTAKGNDSLDGVYIIEAKTGRLLTHINPDVDAGDGDVCGVSVSNERVHFGTDGDAVYTYSFTGEEIQKFELEPTTGSKEQAISGLANDVSADVENIIPIADMNGDGELDLIVATEGGEIYVLDQNNNVLWSWVATTAKVQKYFIGSPALFDVDGDGIPEVFIGSRKREKWVANTGGEFYCLDGKTGKLLWSNDCGSGISSSPHVYVTEKDTSIIVSAAYGDIFLFSTNGQHRVTHLNNPGVGIEGLFGSPVIIGGKIIQGTSWWGYTDYRKDNVWMVSPDSSQYLVTGRVSATATVGQVLKKGTQAVIPTEKGELIVLDYSKRRIYKYWLTSPLTEEMMSDRMIMQGAEASVYLGDVDDDGKTEMIIATLDGFLRCYDTKARWKGSPVRQFRVSNIGHGVVRLPTLGF